MTKRIGTLCLALLLALGAAACGSRTMQRAEETVESLMPDLTPAATASAVLETAVPSAAPELSDAEPVRDVLDAVRDAGTDGMENPVTTYFAAARVLSFCQAGGPAKENFEKDVREYLDAMDDDARAAFRRSAQSVLELAQRIAKGDVEPDELEKNLADYDGDWRDIDPVTFQHDNLKTLADALTKDDQA